MTKEIQVVRKMINGVLVDCVHVSKVRDVYKNECKKHGTLPDGRHSNPEKWYDALGVMPVKVDELDHRVYFRWDELQSALESHKWIPEDDNQHDLFEEKKEDGETSTIIIKINKEHAEKLVEFIKYFNKSTVNQ